MHYLNTHSRMKCYPFRPATEEYTIILCRMGWRETEWPPLSLWHNLFDKRLWKRQHAGGGRVLLHEVSVPGCSVFWSSNTSASLLNACLREGRCKWLNHDAQAAAQAGKGMTGWKSDREFLSSAFQSNGLLIGDRMLSPLQARSLQVKKQAKELGKMRSASRHSSTMPWYLQSRPLPGR